MGTHLSNRYQSLEPGGWGVGGDVGGQGNAGRRNQKLFNGYRFQLLKWKGKERDNGDDVTRCEYLMPLSRTLKTVKRISENLVPTLLALCLGAVKSH